MRHQTTLSPNRCERSPGSRGPGAPPRLQRSASAEDAHQAGTTTEQEEAEDRRMKERQRLYAFLTFSRVLPARTKRRVSEAEAVSLLIQSKLFQASSVLSSEGTVPGAIGWREGRTALRRAQQQSRRLARRLEMESEVLSELMSAHGMADEQAGADRDAQPPTVEVIVPEPAPEPPSATAAAAASQPQLASPVGMSVTKAPTGPRARADVRELVPGLLGESAEPSQVLSPLSACSESPLDFSGGSQSSLSPSVRGSTRRRVRGMRGPGSTAKRRDRGNRPPLRRTGTATSDLEMPVTKQCSEKDGVHSANPSAPTSPERRWFSPFMQADFTPPDRGGQQRRLTPVLDDDLTDDVSALHSASPLTMLSAAFGQFAQLQAEPPPRPDPSDCVDGSERSVSISASRAPQPASPARRRVKPDASLEAVEAEQLKRRQRVAGVLSQLVSTLGVTTAADVPPWRDAASDSDPGREVSARRVPSATRVREQMLSSKVRRMANTLRAPRGLSLPTPQRLPALSLPGRPQDLEVVDAGRRRRFGRCSVPLPQRCSREEAASLVMRLSRGAVTPCPVHPRTEAPGIAKQAAQWLPSASGGIKAQSPSSASAAPLPPQEPSPWDQTD